MLGDDVKNVEERKDKRQKRHGEDRAHESSEREKKSCE